MQPSSRKAANRQKPRMEGGNYRRRNDLNSAFLWPVLQGPASPRAYARHHPTALVASSRMTPPAIATLPWRRSLYVRAGPTGGHVIQKQTSRPV